MIVPSRPTLVAGQREDVSMKQLAIVGIVAVLFACTSLARSGFDAEGVATGKTVLWFSGREVTALIESDFSLDGSIEIEGRTIAFGARGTAFGEATGDSASMTLDVWIVIEAVGATADGEPVSLRGGMAGSSEDSNLAASALGSAAGPFFFVFALGTDSYRAVGTADGSAAGAFVVPDDPLTMQMEGIGTYTLVGDLVMASAPPDGESGQSDYLDHVPWDPASWPPELFARLLALLDGTASELWEEPEGQPDNG
jgi:hypothetical protein